jgi:hypothetical protein
MSQIQLYIGDSQVDLIAGTKVSQSFQAFNIGDLRTRSANNTNRLKAVYSENNHRLFGYSHLLESQSVKPYQKLVGKIISEGIETIPNAVIIVKSAKGVYDLEVYSGEYDFYDIIATKNLRDLDTSDHDTGSLSNKIGTANLNTGLRTIDQDPNGTDWTDPDGVVWPLYDFPYKVVIEEIIKQAGYEKTGSIFSHPKLDALYLSALGYGGYKEEFKRPKEFEATADGTQSVVTSASYSKAVFQNIIGNEAGYFDGDTYFPGDPQGGLYGGAWYTFDAFAVLNVTITGAGSVDFQLFSNTTGAFPAIAYNFAAGTHTMLFELSTRTLGSVSGIFGGECYVRFRAAAGTPTVVIDSGSFRVAVTPYKAAAYLSAQGILPDMNQKDIMQDFLIRFGLLQRERNGVLEFKTIEEIINDKVSFADWTNKLHKELHPSIDFGVSAYAQRNTFDYTVQDEDLDEKTGQGVMLVTNASAQLEKRIYRSPFQACATLKFGNETDGYVWMAYVPVYSRVIDPILLTTVIEEDQEPGLRLLLKRSAYAYEANANDKLYFEDVNAPYSMNFQTFLDEFYPSLSRALQRAKLKTAEYALNSLDIADLNFLKLVYDSGNWFLLNKVYDYVPNQLTKADLFKVI